MDSRFGRGVRKLVRGSEERASNGFSNLLDHRGRTEAGKISRDGGRTRKRHDEGLAPPLSNRLPVVEQINGDPLAYQTPVESGGITDPFADKNQVSPLDRPTPQLDDSSIPPLSGEQGPGLDSTSGSSWLQRRSDTQDKVPEMDSNPQDPSVGLNELEDTSRYSNSKETPQAKKLHRQKEHDQQERHGDNNGQSSRPTARDSGKSDHSQRELQLIERRVRENATGMITENELEAAFKKSGVDGALQLLLQSYRPFRDDLERIGRVISNAAQDTGIPKKERRAALEKGGNESLLVLIVKRIEDTMSAERTMERISNTIFSSTREIIPRKELDHAFERNGGLQAMVEVVLQHLRSGASNAEQLKAIEEKLRRALKDYTSNELNKEFKAAGQLGLLELLLKEYQARDHEYEAFEKDFRKKARRWLSANELDKQINANGVLDLLLAHFQDRIKDLQSNFDRLKGEIKAESSRCSIIQTERDRLAARVRTLEQMDEENRASLREMEVAHSTMVKEIERKWKADFSLLEEEAKEQLLAAERDHMARSEARKATHQSEIKQWEATLESERIDREKEMAEWKARQDHLRKEHSEELAMIKNQWEKRLQEERQKSERFLGALADRDHIKGMSDQELRTKFKKLAREVDYFSRIAWDKRKQAQWPLGEGILMRAQNSRKLKQIIVQTDIWLILNDKIFQTPFAVFGEDGKRLYREWIKEFGQERGGSPVWPEPSEDSEKWRYETAKQRLDDLKRSSNSPGPDARWKESYDRQLADTASQVHADVETVASGDLERAREFVRLAAEFWLELVSQRYRARMYFPPQATWTLGSKMAGLADVQLVTQPELRRSGNAQGRSLGLEQTVQGCEGDFTLASQM